jgi:hypothetical protein
VSGWADAENVFPEIDLEDLQNVSLPLGTLTLDLVRETLPDLAQTLEHFATLLFLASRSVPVPPKPHNRVITAGKLLRQAAAELEG